MRTWGKVNGKWVAVETTPDGDDSFVWITTLVQTLKLVLGESPFYADWGIPAQQSIVTQIAPDYHVTLIQQRFASKFISLTINRVPNADVPTYNITAITQRGLTLRQEIAV